MGRDSKLICQLLTRMGLESVACADYKEARAEAEKGVGVLIVADEVLGKGGLACFSELIAHQPAWSDLPVIVLTGEGEVSVASEVRRGLREPLGNVLLIERPVRPETLASSVKSAMRARTRQYEARDAADALRKSEKLALAGRLAATVAHEINNPLESVTNLHFLMRSAKSLAEVESYLALAESELHRVTEITKQTLKFYRESNQPAEVDLGAVLESVLTMYSRRLTENGVIVARQVKPEAKVMGFPGELRQVLANLVSNALDAMPKGGRLRLRAHPGTDLSNGSRRGVRVVVADTGGGIPPAARAKILEPFFSTKQDSGTGLGLWVSSEILRKHGGSVRYRSRVGKGTVFSVFLPAGSPPLNRNP